MVFQLRWNARIGPRVDSIEEAPKKEVAMASLIAFVLSSVLLVASPGNGDISPGGNDQQDQSPGGNDQQGQQLTNAQVFSVAAGRILGAASACDQIDRARVSTAASKAATLTAAVAADEDELSTAKELMQASAQVGRQAVQDGKADCNVVEASFSKLEKIEQQRPGENHQPDQPD
jgi:hypothetical protein